MVIEPPSEWPAMTTRSPCSLAARTTFLRSPISTRIPHWRAKATSESGISWKCDWMLESVSQPR